MSIAYQYMKGLSSRERGLPNKKSNTQQTNYCDHFISIPQKSLPIMLAFATSLVIFLISSFGLANPVPEVPPKPLPTKLVFLANNVPNVCGSSCEFECIRFTKHTLLINGEAHTSVSGSKSLAVTYDGVAVCPEALHDCHSGKSCNFKWNCNPGWSFYLPDQSLEGPWSYDLQGLPYTRYSAEPNGNMEVRRDDIDCDGYNCGGPNNPMFCRKCRVSSEHVFWTAEKVCDHSG
ncbi:hypothetical protein BS50DRAFT_319017 [Corynespora cassiicola Philippines]|uniref:Uncharacterized protein n=1 Tax=Corynespora cassiicola Philippines TaxID=1448308 RepID=A0A2T2NT11_CORCC|nr:hypothetical protein BS50DRAFT_319017 [Corynespora cassiicola Philippines]